MKALKLISIAFTLLLAISCSKDDEGTNSSAVNNNANEEQNISLEILDQGLSIMGAKKINEALPVPNGNSSFEVDNSQSAFINAGFEFEVKVPLNYAGSYIQFQSTDGRQKSSSYFDVPANSGFSFKKIKKRGLKFISQEVSTSELNATREVRVDFNEIVPPGKFCYTICVYDTEGNISLPQTVCVEVEAWGGNNEIVGNWKLEKYEQIENGVKRNFDDNLGFCQSIFANGETEEKCANGNTFRYKGEECYKINFLNFSINSNGNHSINSEFNNRYINFSETRNQCKEVFEFEVFKNDSSGKWAYDEEEKKLTFITFFEDILVTSDGETTIEGEEEVSDFGFELELVSVSSNSLIVQTEDIYLRFNSETQEREEIKEITKYFFTK